MPQKVQEVPIKKPEVPQSPSSASTYIKKDVPVPVVEKEEEKLFQKNGEIYAPPTPQTVKVTKNVDTEAVNKAIEMTSEKIKARLIHNTPKTAAGFEADFMSLKKDMITFYSYVRQIPVETIS